MAKSLHHRYSGGIIGLLWRRLADGWRRLAMVHPAGTADSYLYQTGKTRALLETEPDFETFFRRYEGQLSGYLRHLIADEETAFDITQETFFRAWKHFAAITQLERPSAWLFRVATNLALNHLRSRAVSRRRRSS